MKKNKTVREELERIYGKHCMIHEGIRKLSPPKVHKERYRGKCIAMQLTLHHLKPLREKRTNNSREWEFNMQVLS